jgi:hypothetical protein
MERRHFFYRQRSVVNSFMAHARFNNADAGAGAGAGGATTITPEAIGALQGDSFRALLPEDVRSKPYVKDINTFGDFVKKFDGAQTLLGQRAVPDATADATAWKAFHEKAAPKTADEYKFPDAIEGLDPAVVKKAGEAKMSRPLLKAADVSPYQANILFSGFMKLVHGAEQSEKTRKDTEFDTLSKDLFGDQKEAILTNGKKFLASHLPEKARALLDTLDEKQLAVVLAATDGMAKKFTGEDPFRGGGAGAGGSGGETKDQLVAQMQAIQKDPVYADPFKDRPKHAELLAKMEIIRGKLKKLQGG